MENNQAALDALTRVAQAEKQLELSQSALANAQSQLSAAQFELAQAVEAQVLATCGEGSGFVQKWSHLLDSIRAAGKEKHYEELWHELLAVCGPGRRARLINTTGRVRLDNRQILLEVYVPDEDELFERLYLFLLPLIPVLCNTTSDVVAEQAAMLGVACRDLSEKANLTLYVHPGRGQYEAVLSSRFEDDLQVCANSLRDLLVWVRTHYPY